MRKGAALGLRPEGERPFCLLHKQSPQAIVSLPRGNGKRLDPMLDAFESPEGQQEDARVIREWVAGGLALPRQRVRRQAPGLSVADLIRADGKPTRAISAVQARAD